MTERNNEIQQQFDQLISDLGDKGDGLTMEMMKHYGEMELNEISSYLPSLKSKGDKNNCFLMLKFLFIGIWIYTGSFRVLLSKLKSNNDRLTLLETPSTATKPSRPLKDSCIFNTASGGIQGKS